MKWIAGVFAFIVVLQFAAIHVIINMADQHANHAYAIGMEEGKAQGMKFVTDQLTPEIMGLKDQADVMLANKKRK